jgi:hypothetical protein
MMKKGAAEALGIVPVPFTLPDDLAVHLDDFGRCPPAGRGP